MRKICLCFLLAAFSFTAASAQKKTMGRKQPNFGLRTGLNVSNLRTDGDAGDTKWRAGFVGGLYFKARAGDRFAIQPELLYSSMGGKFNGPSIGNAAVRLNYFSIPLLANYKICKHLAIVAGPQFDFLIKAKRVSGGGESEIDGYEDHSINAAAGFEFWPARGFGLSARYIHGFTDVNEANPLSLTTPLKNQAVQFTVAIKL